MQLGLAAEPHVPQPSDGPGGALAMVNLTRVASYHEYHVFFPGS